MHAGVGAGVVVILPASPVAAKTRTIKSERLGAPIVNARALQHSAWIVTRTRADDEALVPGWLELEAKKCPGGPAYLMGFVLLPVLAKLGRVSFR